MVSWLRALLPAVPVILDVAREVRRQREPVPSTLPPGNVPGVEAALARATEALERVSADLEQVMARQAVLERRLDVLAIAVWAVGGVLAVTVIGLLVYLVRA